MRTYEERQRADKVASEHRMRELVSERVKAEREERWVEALAICHQIDELQAHMQVLKGPPKAGALTPIRSELRITNYENRKTT